MNAMVSKMLNAYGQSQTYSGVETASPHMLIQMLYEGALVAISNAKINLINGNVAERGASISKAISIIDEGLKVSIDIEAGGEIAQNLVALYEYMSYRLITANLKADLQVLDEVEALLKELKSAWDAIGATVAVKPREIPEEPPRVASSYGKA